MGLLDDAIREHLDLKRRRGADPAEIERAERDALGPVRRNREVDQTGEGSFLDQSADHPAGSARDEDDEGIASNLAEELDPTGAAADDGFRYEDDGFRDGDDRVPDDEDGFAEEEPFADGAPLATDEPPPIVATPSAEAAGEPASPARPTAEPDAFDDDDLFADRDEPRTRLMRAADVPAPDDATSEYEIEDAHARSESEPEPDDGEDVLEETPEFLQDTPDHDRLWFEQRPPRDFDFDG